MAFVASSPFSLPPSELDLARIFTAGGGLPLVEVLVRELANWGGESWGEPRPDLLRRCGSKRLGGACKTLEGVLNYPREQAEVAQLVEHHLAMVRVAGSNPVFRSLPGAEGVGELAAWPSG